MPICLCIKNTEIKLHTKNLKLFLKKTKNSYLHLHIINIPSILINCEGKEGSLLNVLPILYIQNA